MVWWTKFRCEMAFMADIVVDMIQDEPVFHVMIDGAHVSDALSVVSWPSHYI